MHKQESETKWAEQFDRDVEVLLLSENLPGLELSDLPLDYQEGLEVARALRGARVAHLSRVRTSLRQQLTRSGARWGWWLINRNQGVHPMKTRLSKLSPFRQAGLALATLALFISLSLTIQPVRALASQILGQVGFFNLTNEEAIPTEWIGQKNFNSIAEATLTPVSVQSLQRLSVQAAEQQVGFAVYAPSFLPTCYTLNDRIVLLDQDEPGVLTAYHCPGSSVYEDAFLHLSQNRVLDEPRMDFAIGDAHPVEVIVREQQGVWIYQAPIGVQTNPEGETELMPVNILMWEEEGFLFQLRSNKLSEDDLLRVAESLD